MSDLAIVALVVGLVICGAAWGWLQLAKKGFVKSNPTVEKVLGFVVMPLGLLMTILAAGFIGRGALKGKAPREGDEDLAPDEQDTDDDRESEGEHVRRVIEETADREEEHVREVATDDEVAARGAAIFDPGAPPGDETDDSVA